MDVLVPFATSEPKTRLAGVLTPEERSEFARVMLEDVCETIVEAGGSPTVLSTAEIDCEWPLTVDDRLLTTAVNAHLDPPIAVVMADLALATPAALSELFESDGDVVIAPGLGGGTNALVVRHPEFYVDYHGTSVADHRRIAGEIGATVTETDSFRLAIDIDEPEDLVELVLHSDGPAAAWLDDAAVSVTNEPTGGRATVSRDRNDS